MREAVQTNFIIEQEQRVPYLYRYLLGDLISSQRHDLIGLYLFDWEKSLIETGDLQAIGIRWVAKKNESSNN